MTGGSEDSAGSRPFVSVIIPVRNGAAKLERSLAALARQTYPRDRFEVIVADAESSDGSAAVARASGARVLANPRHNLAAGRNLGVAATHGPLLAFLDDDCAPAPDWLERGVAALERDALDALGGPLPLPAGASGWSRAVDWLFAAAARGAGSVQSGRSSSAGVESVPGGNSLYRRRALEQVGPFDEGLWAEDVDMGLRLRAAGLKLGLCAEFVAAHGRAENARALYRQMRRYAIGRAQIWRKHGRGVKPAHAAVWLGGTLAALTGAVAPGTLLLVGAGACVLLTATALPAGLPLDTALLLGPVTLVFVAGWTAGAWAELVRPRDRSAGW
jgi:cellulose synthase/poly-beta-1,6-N-acetylglucosamine synthase-like glycosyltransferase